MRFRRHALCLVLLLLSTIACGASKEQPPRRPNILLISIDALRADRLEAYGYDRPTSPFLAELGRSGLVFENAFVNTHGTTQSHTTILSGLYQEQHGVGMSPASVDQTQIPDSVMLVQEMVRAHGYGTIGVTDRGWMSGKLGFSRGFDRFDDRGGGIIKQSRRIHRFVGEAMAEGKPLFVFLHTYQVHSPYRPPPALREVFGVPDDAPDANNALLLAHSATAGETLGPAVIDALSRLYDAEIRGTDNQLRKMFTELRSLGFLDDAVVIVTSDHGEEFGEHGGLLHRGFLYDELLHVPLIIQGRGIDLARRRELVSSIDIAPTILALAGIPVPETMEGSSLLEQERREVVVSQYSAHRYCIRTPGWKLIWSAPGTIELFDLTADADERHNVADKHPEMRSTLLAALDRWRSDHQGPPSPGPPAELTEDDWRELEALGYLR